jgi:hypothetical protein
MCCTCPSMVPSSRIGMYDKTLSSHTCQITTRSVSEKRSRRHVTVASSLSFCIGMCHRSVFVTPGPCHTPKCKPFSTKLLCRQPSPCSTANMVKFWGGWSHTPSVFDQFSRGPNAPLRRLKTLPRPTHEVQCRVHQVMSSAKQTTLACGSVPSQMLAN